MAENGPVVRSLTFCAGVSWGAGSNPDVATCSFFFFHRIFTLGLVFVFSHCRPFLASREFCDNVFLVNYYQSY